MSVGPDDLAACRWDIAAFSRLLGVDPHPGQERVWREMLKRDTTAFRPLWLTVAISAGNRAGKTLLLAIAILHHSVFKIGMRPPDPLDERELDQFSRLPYHWFHFGIQQETGELVHTAIAQLLTGTHEAQRGRGCPLTESLGAISQHDVKERGEYHWIRIDPVLGGAEIHFRTTAERGIGSLGKDMHGISYDECGFERNLSFILNEVLHNRRLSTGGPMFLISTPSEGFTEWADEWKRGDPDNPLREPDRLSFRLSSRENVGYGIDPHMFTRIVAGIPEHLVPQNIDGFFIQGRNAFFDARAVDRMFVEGLPEEVAREPNHRYVQGVDPAATYDATWSIVLDATEDGRAEGVKATRRGGKQKVVDVAAMVINTHNAYTGDGAECETAVDVTGMGGKVFRELLGDLHPFRGVEFGGTKRQKMRMLTDLKGLIEQGRLRFPRSGVWLGLRKQLLAYILDDRKIEQDAVMALCVATKQVMRQMANAQDTAPFDFFSSLPDEEQPLRKRGPVLTLEQRRTKSRVERALAGSY